MSSFVRTVQSRGYELDARRRVTPGTFARWFEHALATLEVALLGYAAALAIAFPLAIGITHSALLSRTVGLVP